MSLDHVEQFRNMRCRRILELTNQLRTISSSITKDIISEIEALEQEIPEQARKWNNLAEKDTPTAEMLVEEVCRE